MSSKYCNEIRNVAIIAHVDHGKTTLVDQILKQGKLLRENQMDQECFLDSNDLERERGITILSKNISVQYKNIKINLIDTPGHSDFGGQVERVLNLADGVILLVDAAEGPMPQTRFVLEKAMNLNLKAIVVINKVDKSDARPDTIHDKVFDLFAELGANEDQLDFPMLYASGRDGWATKDLDVESKSIFPILDAVIEHVPGPEIVEGPPQMQIASLDFSEYVGRIGIGRVYRGNLETGKPVCLVKSDGTQFPAAIKQLMVFEGLTRSDTNCVRCGDLGAIVGIDEINISDTICDAEHPEALPPIAIDEPTISMIFRVNDSPLYGQEGKYISSRHIRDRLNRETRKDTALRVNELAGEAFEVFGRGVLHLSILIENMRREGYELTVSRPHVIIKTIDGAKHEPIERMSVDVPEESAGKVIELVGLRRGEMISMDSHGKRQTLKFLIPTRGTIGLRSKIMTVTAGEGIVAHLFEKYGKMKGTIPHRTNGVLISMGRGKAIAYAIDGLQQRGSFLVDPNEEVYEGMIVAEHCKDSDLTVNMQKGKQLTNVRASGTDRSMKITPARHLNLEEALEYINEDELVEFTPKSIRLRKRYLTEIERKRKS